MNLPSAESLSPNADDFEVGAGARAAIQQRIDRRNRRQLVGVSTAMGAFFALICFLAISAPSDAGRTSEVADVDVDRAREVVESVVAERLETRPSVTEPLVTPPPIPTPVAGSVFAAGEFSERSADASGLMFSKTIPAPSDGEYSSFYLDASGGTSSEVSSWARSEGPSGADGPAAAEVDGPDSVSTSTDEIPRPQAGLLTAADVDDNLNFEWFDRILGDWQQESGQGSAFNLSDRIALRVVANNGVGAGNVEIRITDGQRSRRVVSTSTGDAFVYPAWLGFDSKASLVAIIDGQEVAIDAVESANGPIEVVVDRDTMPASKLDVALVLDVTGSMADELRFLTVEFESIIERLSADYGNVDMRFALVVYRDSQDAFVTRSFDFTGDVQQMTGWLSSQWADGGGDMPEAMDQALREAEEFSWRPGDDVARVLILNADAPPHPQDVGEALDSARALGSDGVRIYPLAASGVDRSAEFIMRTMAATTGGRHMFLTSDSGIGGEKLEPKALCYVVTRLDDLLLRVFASELAGERIEPAENQIVRMVGTYDRGDCGAP